VAQIAGSIQEFGFNNPVLIDAHNSIIAGHGRVLAAGRLKLQTVPCIRLTHLSDAQRRAYILADNRIALNSGWDTEMLANELSDLHADDLDLGLLGFDPDELGKLLQFETGEPPEPDVPESNYSEQFGVIVVCENEAAQESAFNALQSLGYKCKVVTT
jgi:ParB-like chromosome segregation protein Spo0J